MAQCFGDYCGQKVQGRTNGHAQEHDAITFLKWLDPTGWHNLVGIDPDRRGGLEGRTFAPGQWAEMDAWIRSRDGKLNLHFSVNEPEPTSRHSKLSGRHISAIRAVVVDLDPDDRASFDTERARLRELAGQQSFHAPVTIIDSGGGFQLVWRLRDKIDATEHASAYRAQCRGLAKALGGDPAAIDPSRVFRLPSTWNLPNESKRKRGRERARSALVSLASRSCTLKEVATIYPPAVVAEVSLDSDAEIAAVQAQLNMTAIRNTSSLDDLDADIRTRFQRLHDTDERVRRLWEGDTAQLGVDKSHSAFRAALAVCLARASGFSAQSYGEILFCWDFAVGDGQDHLDVLDARTIARDWCRCGAPHAPERYFGPIEADQPTIWDLAPPDATSNGTGQQWSLVSVQDAARTGLERRGRPLVKGLLDTTALSVVYGEPNAGKSFVVLDIALHVATGTPWGGMKTKACGVLYVAAEGGPGFGRRCRAAATKLGPAFDNAKLSLHLESVDLLDPNADLAPLIAATNAAPEPIGLIVIDTLSRALAGGDENTSVDMGAIVRHVDQIRRRTGAHVLLVHHSGKDLAKGARGHSLLRAAVDTEIEIAAEQIVVRKQRDLDKSFTAAFRLEPVFLGQDEDGDPITSCTVRLVAETEEKPRGEPTSAEAEVLDALCELTNDKMSAGASASQIVKFLASENRIVSAGAVRMHLARMLKKNLVRKLQGAKWAYCQACCAWFSEAHLEIPGAISSQHDATPTQQDIFA